MGKGILYAAKFIVVFLFLITCLTPWLNRLFLVDWFCGIITTLIGVTFIFLSCFGLL